MTETALFFSSHRKSYGFSPAVLHSFSNRKNNGRREEGVDTLPAFLQNAVGNIDKQGPVLSRH